MTDKELSAFGESLYEAVLETPLPVGTIHALATAVRNGTPWALLPHRLKLAIFKVAIRCTNDLGGINEEERSDTADEGSDAALSSATPATPARSPAAVVPGERTDGDGSEDIVSGPSAA